MDACAASTEATRDRILTPPMSSSWSGGTTRSRCETWPRRAGSHCRPSSTTSGPRRTPSTPWRTGTARHRGACGGVGPEHPRRRRGPGGDYDQTGNRPTRAGAGERCRIAEALARGPQHRGWVERTFPGSCGHLRARAAGAAPGPAAVDHRPPHLEELRRDHGLSRAQTEEAIRSCSRPYTTTTRREERATTCSP